ncbi:MAG: InlB B-repeat-containing protein, partial [Sphaerochaetaceae bacterium]|nr:InlB B-repeat-containing protein [Sphaerochaetaceae bacterium]
QTTLPEVTFTRTGYTFAGWATTAAGSVQYTDEDSYTMGTSDATLYARWTLTSYTITYTLNEGTNHEDNPSSYTIESSLITLNDPTRDGYSFSGWYSDAGFETSLSTIPTGSTGDASFYAKWSANSFTVTLDQQSGSGGTESVSATYDEAMPSSLTAPSRSGYTFGGYYDAVTGGTQYYSFTMTSVKDWDKTVDTTLYARWTPISYTITYTLNDGTNHEDNPSSYTSESSLITLNDPTRDGYSFSGWYSDAAFATEASTIAAGSDGDKSFFAKWTADSHSLSFDANGGVGTMDSVDLDTDEQSTLPEVTFTRTGYTFAGWAKTEDGSAEYVDEDSYTMGTSDATLYAKWTELTVGGPGPARGLIFYDKGTYSDGWRYMEAAPKSTEWTKKTYGAYENSVGYPWAIGTEIGTGKANTEGIYSWIEGQTALPRRDEYIADYAAKLCLDLVYNGYSDWFLPSKDELNEMYTNLHAQGKGEFTGGSSDYYYYSSSEYNRYNAMAQDFRQGYQNDMMKDSEFSVRAIRAF